METELDFIDNHKEVCLMKTGCTGFSVLTERRIEFILFTDITHIVFGDDTVIFTRNQKFRTLLTQEEVLQQLPEEQFFRVSRGTVVAYEFICNTHKHYIRVNNYRVHFTRHFRMQVITKLAIILNQQIAFYESKIPGTLR